MLSALVYFTNYFDCFLLAFQVARFIKAVCARTIPKTLLGSNSNWKQFHQHIHNFLHLRRHESMSILQFMNGIKVSDCTWLFKAGARPKHIPASLSNWQKKTLEKILSWLLRHYILPLVRAGFYVTESAMHRGRLFFYRQPTWKIIDALGRSTFLATNFAPVAYNHFNQALNTGETLGHASVRFIPKANKTRPIINLRKGFWKNNSVNDKLKNLFLVLKFVVQQDKTLIGSAVTDLEDLDRKLRGFISKLKDACTVEYNEQPLYFVASDIDSCFDSIPHGKLIEVVDKSMQNDAYLLRKLNILKLDPEKKPKISVRRIGCHSSDGDSFPVFLRKLLFSKTTGICNSIIGDGSEHHPTSKAALMSLLKSHVERSFVKVENKYYHRTKGSF